MSIRGSTESLRLNGPTPSAERIRLALTPGPKPVASLDTAIQMSNLTAAFNKLRLRFNRALRNYSRPGGWGIFATHGQAFFRHLQSHELRELLEKGFYYRVGGNTKGLPAFYQNAFQTADYTRRQWAPHFEVVALRESGLADQDAVLVRKR